MGSKSNEERADLVEKSASQLSSQVGIFLRLSRIQFTPLIFLPALVGASLAYSTSNHSLNLPYLGLTLTGVILLHLGANAIDDCYDYENGVDRIANSMFPPDFGGWKPVPRGLISLNNAKIVSYSLLAGSLAIAGLLTYFVGFWALFFGAVGVVLAIVYTAPPFKLDYRGAGLGELSILCAFGPLPTLGSYYVQTGHLSLTALLLSLPIGLMTVTILIDHDTIFYEVYMEARKLSLATVLGRRRALKASFFMSIIAYVFVILMALLKMVPIWSISAPIVSALILCRKAKAYSSPDQPPPFYVSLTQNGLLADWIFSLVLAVSLLI